MKQVVAVLMGLGGMAWLGYETSWDVPAAVFFMIWGNNLSRPRSCY